MKFMRITILGASGCGKTSLISAFVSNYCGTRYMPTENAVVFHKKLEIVDEGEYEEVRKPIFLEIEDTPGSEKGVEDAGDDDEKKGPPTVRKGARVTVVAERAELIKACNNPKYKDLGLYKPLMDGMCGKDYTVKTVNQNETVALPSPDGSEGGYWNFPPKAVKLKTSMETPIDQFLLLGEKAEPNHKMSQTQKRQWQTDRLMPLKADFRVTGPPDQDHTYSKNRMGYFLCFDLSDEEGSSLVEAMSVYAMLKKALEKRKTQTLKPIIWLVGCKLDKTSQHECIRRNTASALAFSEAQEVPCHMTSARLNEGVTEVFQEMIQSITAKPTLWTLEADENNETEEESGCTYNVM